ncbi:hypothetical protein AKJ63_00535 [candidate division MSBL1 archaeon SCGC-AAA259D18]|uniref:HTH arsR-type domain-containing protein n=1 Tax=candidate division MSBL1 archaeon SCGC-AAA259D18 TaxID=1698262 RepID=A0A133UCH7_9EURY|nr:hypothetical protein AKJ63_00535 [candidate division MSBL1 archaeon SCGC-AAA259D18]
MNINEKSYSRLFQALADESRMKIILEIREEEKSVTEICSSTGLEQSSVSHHLKCLTNCGFAERRVEGNRRFYSANSSVLDELFSTIDRHIENHRKGIYTCEVLDSE